jgi:hypothetical protein
MEQCDNGNNTGCSSGCVYDLGFTCTGYIGVKSTCISYKIAQLHYV